MRNSAIITFMCIFAAQCNVENTHSAAATDDIIITDADSIVMATLPSLADIPAIPSGVVIGIPSEASLQKPVRSYPEFKGGEDDQQGFIKDCEIIRGRHPLLDEQALKIVENFPRWQPAFDNSETMEISFILPVTFKK